MDKREADITYFLSYCVEEYKARHGLTGAQAMARFEEAGILPYLFDNYDALHTQGPQWIMEEIEEFLAERKEAAQ